jgi:xanthine dehydrogenase iron-sulfur cluster and FAD-binding subunit A
MVMSSLELLQRERHPSEERVRAWLKGNFCRCTGYQNIVDAVLATGGIPAAHEAGAAISPPSLREAARDGNAAGKRRWRRSRPVLGAAQFAILRPIRTTA